MLAETGHTSVSLCHARRGSIICLVEILDRLYSLIIVWLGTIFEVVYGTHFVMKIRTPAKLDRILTFSLYDKKDWRCPHGISNFNR